MISCDNDRMKNHIPLRGRDTAAQLRAAAKQTKNPVLALRLRAVARRREGKDPQEIAESLLVTDRAVRGWVLLYNAGGIGGLRPKPPGRPEGNPKWDAKPFEDLAKEIEKGGYWSVPRMQAWLAERKKLDVPQQTVWYRVRAMGYSYKSARPHPEKGSGEAQDAFKKGAWRRS